MVYLDVLYYVYLVLESTWLTVITLSIIDICIYGKIRIISPKNIQNIPLYRKKTAR